METPPTPPCLPGNLSDDAQPTVTAATGNFTGNKEVYEIVYNNLYMYGLPIICMCGFVGNVMNLVILAGKRIQHSLRRMERSANVGLIALAVADMSFCLCAFPSTFLPIDSKFASRGFLTYYACYCAAVINVFIFTSTWLTVTMSMERYLAISHPLRSRNIITLPRTKAVIVLVYVFSVLFNIPVFWRYTIKEQQRADCTGVEYVVEPTKTLDEGFDHAYRALWAVLGNFTPLLLLLFSNVGLMRQIHKSYAMRRQMNGNAGIRGQSQADQETNNRITITLVAIVLMFLILVAPSEVLKHAVILFFGDLNANYTYMTCEIITNLMQTINFSANFLLYCIINPSFRRSMREMFCFRCTGAKHHDDFERSSFRDASAHPNNFTRSTRVPSTKRSQSARHTNRSSPQRGRNTPDNNGQWEAGDPEAGLLKVHRVQSMPTKKR